MYIFRQRNELNFYLLFTFLSDLKFCFTRLWIEWREAIDFQSLWYVFHFLMFQSIAELSNIISPTHKQLLNCNLDGL